VCKRHIGEMLWLERKEKSEQYEMVRRARVRLDLQGPTPRMYVFGYQR